MVGIGNLTAAAGTLFFTTHGLGPGQELWASDGTPGGTRMVQAIDLVPPPASPVGAPPRSELTAIGRSVYFAAQDASGGQELWRSDGTAAGTARVRDINPGPASSSPRYLTAVGDRLDFIAHDSRGVGQLWESDGTARGTAALRAFSPPLNGSSFPADLTDIGGAVYFSADDGIHGKQLWESDGTPGGTVAISDPVADARGGSPHNPVVLNGATYFEESSHAISSTLLLYRNDGHGPVPVAGIPPIAYGSLARAGRWIYFDTLQMTGDANQDQGLILWKSDGTPGGTSPIATIDTAASLESYSQPTEVNGTLFFFVRESRSAGTRVQLASQLWKSDGTVAGTVKLATIPTAAFEGAIGQAVAARGRLFFTITTDSSGGEALYTSDGTAGGTVRLARIPGSPGQSSRPIEELTASGGLLYFAARDPELGPRLWRSDGTARGTIPLTTPRPGGLTPVVHDLTDVNGTLFFVGPIASDPRTPRLTAPAIWKSDGTPSGTAVVSEIFPQQGASLQTGGVRQLVSSGGRLYFLVVRGGGSSSAPTEIWRSDGTRPGTGAVQGGLPPALSLGTPLTRLFHPVGGRLVFTASDLFHGQELWVASDLAGVPVNHPPHVASLAPPRHGHRRPEDDPPHPGDRSRSRPEADLPAGPRIGRSPPECGDRSQDRRHHLHPGCYPGWEVLRFPGARHR